MGYISYKDKVLAVMKDSRHEFCTKVGTLVVANTQNLTKVLSGNLKRSQVHEVMPGDVGVVVGVTADAPYALTIEKGLAGHAAQPFLEPGAMQSIPQIKNVVNEIYRSRLGGG